MRNPPATLSNVIELRAGQPEGHDLASPATLPVAPGSPDARPPPQTTTSRRNRGERAPPTGTDAMLADEGRALASWNTLAAATGMVQGTINAQTRRRIGTILAIGDGL